MGGDGGDVGREVGVHEVGVSILAIMVAWIVWMCSTILAVVEMRVAQFPVAILGNRSHCRGPDPPPVICRTESAQGRACNLMVAILGNRVVVEVKWLQMNGCG